MPNKFDLILAHSSSNKEMYFPVLILRRYQQNSASAKGGGLALRLSENPRVGSSILSLGTFNFWGSRLPFPQQSCRNLPFSLAVRAS